ncbi:MAG: ferric reductase-like transmembrane domain-containing protein [Candidatus Shapirobacteria bacterium]|nr:ferric reductase-like transmembrane domain-containing protein [Candidatus Shapirobacteria bacterium]MDD5482008.1 ferric reductase-like transmembrane domain-containing protein [Candidatus Shapirobacteria bacterium]
MDAKNTPIQHLLVGVLSLALVFGLRRFLGLSQSVVFARAAFLLLFLTLIIGPITKLKKPSAVSSPLKLPWSWRSELGIWFAITSLAHFYFAMSGRPQWNFLAALGGGIGGEGYGLANLLGLIALFWSLILAFTSPGKIIKWLGVGSWKWLHSMTYVIFYLVATHTVYFQFFSKYRGGPDWFGWPAVLMAITIIFLQLWAFAKTLADQKRGKE